MKNFLKGTNHFCLMTWKEATIGAGYALSWAAAPSSSQADVAMWLST
jgi:hypothetical protein